ncbi:hypothetical protein [Amycolatopsis sp. WGS_07]|uniref:hypothetical protein n=1 Tax=Amycolatopsis sp. WGS_07 TaxID=3076764 RepID=UPI003872B330
MTTIAVGLMAAGAVLLAAGFVMVITQRPHAGVNFGGDGAFFFGLGATAGGLLIGAAAAVAWLRARKREPRVATPLLAWEKRLRSLTAAAVGLIAAGAVVQSGGAVVFATGYADGGTRSAVPALVTGVCIVAAGFLAGVPPTVYWWSKRRTRVDR